MLRPQLISFDLCPYVQRSIITLLHKGIEFDTTFIDLRNKPDWFLEISPTGKVPVLREGSEVLFESTVINEYLDETRGEPLMPRDALTRAKHRAWIDFSGGLLGTLFGLMNAKTREHLDKKVAKLRSGLAQVEKAVSETGPFFQGETLALVDTAWAPFFMRVALLDEKHDLALYDGLPRVARWAEALLTLPEVQNSVPEGFQNKMFAYLKMVGSVFG